MYKISVPIMNVSVTIETRDTYLGQLKSACVDRVFLVVMRPDGSEGLTASVRENAEFFMKNGIEVGIWIGSTIGHGVALAAPGGDGFSNTEKTLVNLAGEPIGGTHCPLDGDFRKSIAHGIAELARTGVGTILLDDDFRLSAHGSEFCCACEAHMEKIQKLCGESISREELKKKAFMGKANKYRDAWLCAQGDSLRLLAGDVRAAVDAVNPDVRVAYCSPPTIWEIDGSSSAEIAKILAGRGTPEARLIGAPYWVSQSGRAFATVFELERMTASLCADEGVETMAEGDVYPRPSYNVPASHLELFDAVMRADGQVDGILKYMIGYTTSPNYDTAYLRRHEKNLPVMKEISELFDGKTACGVYIPTRAHLLDGADLSLGTMSDRYTYPLAGTVLGSLSLPTTYTEGGICAAVFGEEARHIDPHKISKGAVLDGVAAAILAERGIDVGLDGEVCFESARASFMLSHDGKDSAALCRQSARFMRCALSERATAEVCVKIDEETVPLLYTYENADGGRFAVFVTDTMAKQYVSDLCRGFMMQKAMTDAVEWIARERLPARCDGNPDLYMLCKRGESGELAVGLFNCCADSILEPEVRLDRDYREIRFVNCSGTLCGDTVRLDKPISAFEFAAFEVK